MKIICPTDFSERARAAARVAVDLARRTSGSVELLHVATPLTTDFVGLAAGAVVFDPGTPAEAQAKLAAECRELSEGGGVAVSSSLAEGDVESVIRARAEAIGADLIVMGAHGRPALERFVLGSVAERTVRRADRPVLIMPPGAKFLERRTNGKAQLRVMVAFDGRAGGEGALDFVRSLRARVSCDVTVLRLYWPVEEFSRLGLVGQRPLTTPDPDVVADLERSLRAQVGALPGGGSTAFAVEPAWGEPAACILDAATAHEADLVIMGAESRRGLARIAHPPVASRVAHQASGVPIVFVPAAAPAPAQFALPAFSTVLVPTDLSAPGNRAIPFAYSLLAARGGVVELCHVHERRLPVPPYLYDRAEGKLTGEQRAGLESELRALVPPEAARLGIVTHVTVIDGEHAAEAIGQAAERLAVDAIALGSHGRGAAYRSVLGSVSQDVVRHARRPVLVIPVTNKEAS